MRGHFRKRNYSGLSGGIPRKKPSDEESKLQMQFAHWLDGKGVLYTASCAGMQTHVAIAIKMKRMGAKKGVPDIIIFEPRGSWHGLTLELKSKTGKVSPEQKEWQEALILRGYKALIMPPGLSFWDGLEWLKEKTNQYLENHEIVEIEIEGENLNEQCL